MCGLCRVSIPKMSVHNIEIFLMSKVDLENLCANMETIPVIRFIDLVNRVLVEEDFERFNPDWKDGVHSFLNGIRVLILHHVQRRYALLEYCDGSGTR